MTSFNRSFVQADTKKYVVLWAIDTAISKDSQTIRDEYERSIDHYLKPYSRQWSDPLRRFLTLKLQWESETKFLSSITDIVLHPAYQQIIGMGPIVVPMILIELKKKPVHWFWALKAITGEDPVPPASKGRLREMTDVWLLWGKKQGYLI